MRKSVNEREENILLNLFTARKATIPLERRVLDGVNMKDNEKIENWEDWENDKKDTGFKMIEDCD